jgi:hypothetical protein
MTGNRRVFRLDQYNNTSEKVHNHQYLQLMLILPYIINKILSLYITYEHRD